MQKAQEMADLLNNPAAASPPAGSEVKGNLGSSVIASVMKAKRGGIDYCFEKAAKQGTIQEGKVVVNFTINEVGDISQYRLEASTVNDSEAEACILRMIRRYRFPPPSSGTVNVSYPFFYRKAR